MKIKDLQNIDIKELKNIDWFSIKDRIFNQPHQIVNIIIMCVTVITVFVTYRMWISTNETLKTEITQLQAKSAVLDEFETTQNQISKFLDSAPEVISENRLIEMLSKNALESGVQILSLSPTTKKSDSFTRLTNISITIASEQYSDIIRFMHKLENSSYSLRVNGWSGGPNVSPDVRRYGWGGSNRRVIKENTNSNHVEATVEIETVEFK